MDRNEISQNFFTWFHPSWSSVSETKIRIPGPNNPSRMLPLLSLCLWQWDRVQTGAETVPSAEFHRSKRVKWRKNICAKLSCWWYIGHGSCPANHFLTVKALGPLLDRFSCTTRGPKRCAVKITMVQALKGAQNDAVMTNWNQDKSRQKSSNCWLSLMMREASTIMSGKVKKLAHWKQFDDFPRHLRVRKQNSNLLKLVPELLQDFLDAWTIWNQHIFRDMLVDYSNILNILTWLLPFRPRVCSSNPWLQRRVSKYHG